MKNPFTNTSSNLSNIFHNNIHRKKGESLKVRSTKKFFPGSAAGAAALKLTTIFMDIYPLKMVIFQ